MIDLLFAFVFSLMAFCLGVIYLAFEYPLAAGFFLFIVIGLWLMRKEQP